MALPRLLSADDHVLETPDIWTGRLSRSRWGDRVPHIETVNGVQRWVADGRPGPAAGAAAALLPNRFARPSSWEEVPPAAYDPAERLKAMDRDGVAMSVLYPTAAGIGGEVLGAIQDPELEAACVQAYNDWLLEVWAAASQRFIPQCLIPIASPQAADAEARRALAAGHRGVVMPAAPWHINPKAPHIHDQSWDALWAVVQEAGVPLCFHAGTDEQILLPLYEGFDEATARAMETARPPISSAQVVFFFLLSGIGERFPSLQVVFGDTTAAWLPSQLELADHQARKSMLEKDGMDVTPTEIYHRQCSVTFSFDSIGLGMRDAIGIGNLLWHAEFPRETSTWPESASTLERTLQDVPEAERRKLTWENAARLYGIRE